MIRALGIDLGDARIGLAIGDELGMMAHPLETMVVKQIPNSVEHIAKVVERNKIGIIVLGMPRNMDGTYGPAAEKSRVFADKLRKRMPDCTVQLWDERLTSVAAQKALHEAGRNVKQGRAVIDQVAAQMILQGWLDSQSFQA